METSEKNDTTKFYVVRDSAIFDALGPILSKLTPAETLDDLPAAYVDDYGDETFRDFTVVAVLPGNRVVRNRGSPDPLAIVREGAFQEIIGRVLVERCQKKSDE